MDETQNTSQTIQPGISTSPVTPDPVNPNPVTPPIQSVPPTPPVQSQPVQNQNSTQTVADQTDQTKTIIVIVLLLIAYPIGLIFMYVWMKWRMWIKIVLTLPFVLGLLAGVAMVIFGFTMGGDIMSSALECSQQCESAEDSDLCMEQCFEQSTNIDVQYDTDSENF